MAGNERTVVKYLLTRQGIITLRHIGRLDRIEGPSRHGHLVTIGSEDEVTPDQSGKKADIFLNGKGVSIKQSGSVFLFNRLQRSELLKVFSRLNFHDPNRTVGGLDSLVTEFHEGRLSRRDRPWSEGFQRESFRRLLRYLMMEGSPNLGESVYPADFILTAPPKSLSDEAISVQSFDEYFEEHEREIYLSIRRSWIGQSSNTEHKRAISISSKPGNDAWVFTTIAGSPRSWRPVAEVPIEARRTVYMIFISVVPQN